MNTTNNISAGTGRKMRFTTALDPDSVQPYDQTTEDFLRYAQEYSKYLQYFNEDNEPDGDWSQFPGNRDELEEMARYLDEPESFDEVQRERFSRPHVALFLCFLGLLRHAQKEFNRLPKRHLDYYYREVLRLDPRPARPDSVHVLFTLGKAVKQYLLPSGTALNAGADEEGKTLTYITEHSLFINLAKVVQIKNLYRNDGKLYSSIAPVQLTAPPDPGVELKRWKTFGSMEAGNEVQLGLFIASPLLMLSEGPRKIKMTFQFGQVTVERLLDLFKKIRVFASRADGMMELPAGKLTAKPANETDPVTFLVELGNDDPAIEPLKAAQAGFPASQWPIIKLVLTDPDKAKGIVLKGMKLSVEVTELTKLIATNTQGSLNTTKPFEPFGPDPLIGTEFRLTHPELIAKRPDSITLNLIWAGGIPNLGSYYQTSAEVGIHPKNSQNDIADFLKNTGLVKFQLIESPKSNSVDLFTGSLFAIAKNEISNNNLPQPTIPPAEITEDNITQYRHLNLTLTGDGFLLEKYPSLQNKLSVLAAGETPTVNATVAGAKTTYEVGGLKWTRINLPQVYIPKLKTISLSYTASAADTDNNQIQLYTMHPFGYAGPVSLANNGFQVSQPYSNDGELYFGIEGLEPPQNLSLLLKLSEGSAEPEAPAAKVTWSYLSDNQWLPSMTAETPPSPFILSDDSNGLLQSGIIRFSVPSGFKPDSTIMPPGLFWLRATVSPVNKDVKTVTDGLACTDAVSDLLAVHTQAVKTIFRNNNNSEAHLQQPLKPLAITELAVGVPEIDKIIQPYTSFGGRPGENDLSYYTRVSERLRHKNRALSIWDYERLVLENFPGIYKVKCVCAEDDPGLVTLVVIPDIKLQRPFAPFEPKAPVNTLREIESFLQEKSPAYAEIKVINPKYTIVQVNVDVRFCTGCDPGYYINVLQEALRQHLSPWAYEEGADIEFDQTIYAGAIAWFIEKLPYVDFITGLRLYLLKDGRVDAGTGNNLELSTDSNAIWVSAREHLIRVIETDIVNFGIGTMRLEYDFEIAK